MIKIRRLYDYTKIHIAGLRAQIIYWALGLGREHE